MLVRAPGRVNLLGGHVDYSDGWVLPCAIEPALHLTASARADRRLELHLPDVGWSGALEVDRLPPPLHERESPHAGEEDLAAGVVWALLSRGHGLSRGASLTVRSSIPIGAGVSSSAAFEVATVLALAHLEELELSHLEVAEVGRACENGYLGLGSGIMDQYVSRNGRAGCALVLDCRTLTHRTLPLPRDLRLLIADSGVRRRLVASRYGDRAAECAQALELLRPERPDLRTLRDLPPHELDAAVALLPPVLGRRVRHVVTECRRVLRGAEALERGDLDEVAGTMRAAHESLRDDFEVTVPELDLLAETAWETPGAHGARAFGGGFGGCVVVLVEEDAAESLSARLTHAFAESFGRAPGILLTDAGPGAEVSVLG